MTDKIANPGATVVDAISQLPAAARDFVQRTAAVAKERAVGVHANGALIATALQDVANVSVNSSALVARSLLKGAHQNVEATLGLVHNLGAAKDLGEAIGVQLDFIRDYAKANVEQFRATAEIVHKAFTDGGKAVREAFAKPVPDPRVA
jgi:hypothetical protein